MKRMKAGGWALVHILLSVYALIIILPIDDYFFL